MGQRRSATRLVERPEHASVVELPSIESTPNKKSLALMPARSQEKRKAWNASPNKPSSVQKKMQQIMDQCAEIEKRRNEVRESPMVKK